MRAPLVRQKHRRKHSESDQNTPLSTRRCSCVAGLLRPASGYDHGHHVRAATGPHPRRKQVCLLYGDQQTVTDSVSCRESEMRTNVDQLPMNPVHKEHRPQRGVRSFRSGGRESGTVPVDEPCAPDHDGHTDTEDYGQLHPENEDAVSVVNLDDPAALDRHLPMTNGPQVRDISVVSQTEDEDDGSITEVDLDDPVAMDLHLPLSGRCEALERRTDSERGEAFTAMSQKAGMKESLPFNSATEVCQLDVGEASHDECKTDRKVVGPRSADIRPEQMSCIGANSGDEEFLRTINRDSTDNCCVDSEDKSVRRASDQDSTGCLRQLTRRVLLFSKRRLMRWRQMLCNMWSRMTSRRQWSMIWVCALCDSLGFQIDNTTLMLVWIYRLFNE